MERNVYIKSNSVFLFCYRCRRTVVSEESESDSARKKKLIKNSKLSQSSDGIMLLWDVANLQKHSAPFTSSVMYMVLH